MHFSSRSLIIGLIVRITITSINIMQSVEELFIMIIHRLCNAFLEKYSSVSINGRNIKILATEMFKVNKYLTPPLQQILKLNATLNMI